MASKKRMACPVCCPDFKAYFTREHRFVECDACAAEREHRSSCYQDSCERCDAERGECDACSWQDVWACGNCRHFAPCGKPKARKAGFTYSQKQAIRDLHEAASGCHLLSAGGKIDRFKVERTGNGDAMVLCGVSNRHGVLIYDRIVFVGRRGAVSRLEGGLTGRVKRIPVNVWRLF